MCPLPDMCTNVCKLVPQCIFMRPLFHVLFHAKVTAFFLIQEVLGFHQVDCEVPFLACVRQEFWTTKRLVSCQAHQAYWIAGCDVVLGGLPLRLVSVDVGEVFFQF